MPNRPPLHPAAPAAAPSAAAATRPRRPRDDGAEARGKQAINAALELFNRRWVLRVLWELRGEPLTFRPLQAACGELSTSVLNQRLAELRDAMLVEHAAGSGYTLSASGRDLLQAMRPLLAWAAAWDEALRRAR